MLLFYLKQKKYTKGWVKCSLCPPSSQKRFAFGKGFNAHLECIHAPSLERGNSVKDIEAWPKEKQELIKIAG